MGLTNPVLVFLLAAAVIALLAATLWYWPRLAGPGWRRVGLRVAALCALQACVLSLIFVVVNRGSEFYSSWSDLLGSDNGAGAVLAVDGHGIRSSELVHVSGSVPVVIPGRGRDGRLETVVFHGQLSGLTVAGHIYLPPGYPRAGRRYPVIIALSDQLNSAGSAYGAARLAAGAAVQIAAGQLKPAILVMLPAWLRSDKGCLNAPGGMQAAMFFAQDVPEALQAAYHASMLSSRWGLLGDAAGGYCALQLLMDNSTVFSAAAVPAGNYANPPASRQAAVSPQFRLQDNLTWQLRHLPMQPVSVLFAELGRAARLGQAAAFASLVRPPMRVAVAGLSPGAWPLGPALDWLGQELGS